MTLTLDLPPNLESSLFQAANQQSLTVEEFVIQMLASAFMQKERQKKDVSLLESWLSDADIEKQIAKMEFVYPFGINTTDSF